ncbi:MAG: clostripain-related cysteine peptidase [Candidatus Wallbacteria bacterium]|nr:clostripain-related cysteine peptidase [Candidatus Wallbacteria bacterium]
MIKFGLFCLFFFLAAVPLFAEKPWTVMVFLNGDNDLDSAGKKDVQEMMKVGGSSALNIVVLQDGYGPDNTRRLVIGCGTAEIEKLPELDMGDWNQAFDFFKWSVDNYPAQHYLYVIWNHGDGWRKNPANPLRGISYDFYNNSHISTPQLGLLSKKMNDYIGRKIDILGYDACLMAMAEVICETGDYVDYTVGSEETIPVAGWPYDLILSSITAEPGIKSGKLAGEIVRLYQQSYSGGSQGSAEVTLSAINSSALPGMIKALNDFTADLTASSFYNDRIQGLIEHSQEFMIRDYIDLGDFAVCLKTDSSGTLKIRAENLLKTLSGSEGAIISNGNTGGSVSRATGLSVYIPTRVDWDGNRETYRQLKFSEISGWDEFLDSLYHPQGISLSFDMLYICDQNGEYRIDAGDELNLTAGFSNIGSTACGKIIVKMLCQDEYLSLSSASGGSILRIEAGGSETLKGLKAQVAKNCPVGHVIRLEISAATTQGELSSVRNVTVGE